MIEFNTMKPLLFFLITLSFLNLSTITTKAGVTGYCDQEFMDLNNNIFYMQLQLQKNWGKDLPWVYTAIEGGLDECKKFFRKGESSIMSQMKGSSGWVSMGHLMRRNISKKQFCNSKGPFSSYGLGESALIYCSSNQNSLSNISDYKICKGSLNISMDGWVNTNNYVQEALARDFKISDCRVLLLKETKVSTDIQTDTVESNSPVNRLKQLKELLNEGLISEELYEQKSSEILDEL